MTLHKIRRWYVLLLWRDTIEVNDDLAIRVRQTKKSPEYIEAITTEN